NVDVNGTVLDIAKLLRPTLGEQIEIDSILEPEVATAHIDASQLANSLLNMAINARDAMPEGGKLLLETRNVVLDEAYAAAIAAAAAPLTGGSETILVVEDDELVRNFVTTQLQSLGYQTIDAADGPTALTSIANGVSFDLLFTDVILPNGMTGRQLADEAT